MPAAQHRKPVVNVAAARGPRSLRWVLGLLDRLLLVGAVLCAGAIPSFIAQYRQRLGGRLEQVLRDLAPFQEIANRQHGGSLDALIRYHLASTDRTFHAEGQAIQDMVDALDRLRSSAAALNTDLWHQLWYLARHLDAGLARGTWDSFVPSVSITFDGVAFALLLGLLLWLVVAALWSLFARLFRS